MESFAAFKNRWDTFRNAMKPFTARVTLGGLVHSARLSQETNAFRASVYLDGRKVAVASNDGHGGQTLIVWLDTGSRLDVEAGVKAALESARLDSADDRDWFKKHMGVEAIVDDMVADTIRDLHRQKRWKRFVGTAHKKNHHAVRMSDDAMYSVPVDMYDAWVAKGRWPKGTSIVETVRVGGAA
jgi:hypothetical protein